MWRSPTPATPSTWNSSVRSMKRWNHFLVHFEPLHPMNTVRTRQLCLSRTDATFAGIRLGLVRTWYVKSCRMIAANCRHLARLDRLNLLETWRERQGTSDEGF